MTFYYLFTFNSINKCLFIFYINNNNNYIIVAQGRSLKGMAYWMINCNDKPFLMAN